MPGISRNAHGIKQLACVLAIDIVNKEVGEQIVLKLKDKTIVWERIR